MAGISSKAAGGLENKKKYNGYEFNSDFNINLYESFYRSHDPQIGRFLQIDPKIEAAEAWSPYSAMLNSPIRNIDPLGDSTIFYNTNGGMLGSLPDGNKSWTVSFLDGENANNFSQNVKTQESMMMMEFGEVDYSVLTENIRQTGFNYDTKEYFDYSDKNSKDYSTDLSTFKPNDGKGPLANEHGANLIMKGNNVSIANENIAGGPGAVTIPPIVGEVGKMHLHVNEGRGILLNDGGTWKAGKFQTGEASLGIRGISTDALRRNTDINNTRNDGIIRKTADVVVQGNTIYFYNAKGILVTFNR